MYKLEVTVINRPISPVIFVRLGEAKESVFIPPFDASVRYSVLQNVAWMTRPPVPTLRKEMRAKISVLERRMRQIKTATDFGREKTKEKEDICFHHSSFLHCKNLGKYFPLSPSHIPGLWLTFRPQMTRNELIILSPKRIRYQALSRAPILWPSSSLRLLALLGDIWW